MKNTLFRGLTPATRRWCRAVGRDFVLEEHHARLLLLAARAWEAAETAQSILDREGMTYRDRFNNPRRHPAASILTDARTAFSRLLRELSLDGAAGPDETPRPPRISGGRR